MKSSLNEVWLGRRKRILRPLLRITSHPLGVSFTNRVSRTWCPLSVLAHCSWFDADCNLRDFESYSSFKSIMQPYDIIRPLSSLDPSDGAVPPIWNINSGRKFSGLRCLLRSVCMPSSNGTVPMQYLSFGFSLLDVSFFFFCFFYSCSCSCCWLFITTGALLPVLMGNIFLSKDGEHFG